MNILKQPIFLAILVLAMVSAIIWNFWGSKKSSPNPTEATSQTTQEQVSNLTNASPEDFDLITKKELTLANSKAVEARSDNILSAIEVSVGPSLQMDSVSTRYIYTSSGDPSNNWLITIAQSSGSYIRASIPVDDYLGQLTAINTKLWKYNYVTALKLAEKNGGLTWREANTLSEVKLTLKHYTNGNNALLWIVEYIAVNNSNLTIKLDANSGKLIQ